MNIDNVFFVLLVDIPHAREDFNKCFDGNRGVLERFSFGLMGTLACIPGIGILLGAIRYLFETCVVKKKIATHPLQQKNHKKISSAILIQSAYRGYKARKEVSIRHDAALCIQTSYKRHLVQKQVQKQKKAAIVIQSAYRGHQVYTAYTKLKTAVNTLKGHYRRKKVTHVLSELKAKRTECYRELFLPHEVPSCGSKHDNLAKVRNAALPEEIGCLPPFFGFTDDEIKALFSEETRALWEEISFSKSIKRLEDLQRSIYKDILTSDLPLSDAQKRALFGLQGKTLIVRSSSNEDGNAVNAGGNETIPGVVPTKDGIRKALAKVVSSYFSLQSFKNRMSFEDVFLKMPLCSVLIMEQELGDNIISGVMMTHKPDWSSDSEGNIMQISATYGFGGGVVSGSIPSDEWIVADDTIYPTIRKKIHRKTVSSDGISKTVVNDPSREQKPCLEDKQIQQLKRLGNYLEALFHCHVDVEFVIRGDKIYIVQVRPIQAQSMKDPTFIDPDTIPETAKVYAGKTIVPGENKVLCMDYDNILFASTLEIADRMFDPKLHKAVIVYTPPNASNTHAAVNFASARPPLPCFVLSRPDWEKCGKWSHKHHHFNLCPQTATVVRIDKDISSREGLLLHPAQSILSIGTSSKTIQFNTPSQEIEEVTKLLSTTPEILERNLSTIQEKVAAIFKRIFSHKIYLPEVESVARSLESLANQILQNMQISIQKGESSHLSLHAGMLRQMFIQSQSNFVAAHSVAGVEKAISISPSIENFMQRHEENQTLCQLAIMGQKAFDQNTLDHWVQFMESHLDAPQLHELLTLLERLEALDMLTYWFALHFTEKVPTLEEVLREDQNIEWLEELSQFDNTFQHLQEQLQKVVTAEELLSACEQVQIISHTFTEVMKNHKERTLLQDVYIAKVFTLLINLWDTHIKTLRSSHLFSEEETKQKFEASVNSFAGFGLDCVESSLIRDYRLSQLLRELLYDAHKESHATSFAVERFLIPVGECCGRYRNDDEKLSIIHQNLLQLATPNFSKIRVMLPSPLQGSVSSFMEDMTTAKRFSGNTGNYVIMSQDSISVRINVPLNLHSFLVTMTQNKDSQEVEFSAYWRGSDNRQGAHKEFIKVCCDLFGITIKNYQTNNNDLEVTMIAKDEKQISLINQLMKQVNDMTLYGKNYFERLIYFVYREENPEEDFDIDHIDSKYAFRIYDYFFESFLKTGKLSTMVQHDFMFARGSAVAYLQQKSEYLTLLHEKVLEELKSQQLGKYARNFMKIFLSLEEYKTPIEELIVNDLKGEQKFDLSSYLPGDLKRKLCREMPIAILQFCKKNNGFYSYDQAIKEMIKNGSPISNEEANLIKVFIEREQLRYSQEFDRDTVLEKCNRMLAETSKE